MKIIREKRIGETRYGVYQKRRLVELRVERWSLQGRPKKGDIFAGRVKTIEKSLAAAFIDLGTGPDGFLNFTLAGNAPRLTQGQMIEVEVLREAEAEKGPVLRFAGISDAEKPGPISSTRTEQRLLQSYKGAQIEDGVIEDFDAALEPEYSLSGGGRLFIEPTRAATTFDVDIGQAKSKRDVAIAAAKQVAFLVRLRGMGGLFLVDFPNLRKTRDRKDVWQCLSDELAKDPATTKLNPMSRFGTALFTRQKSGQSVTQIMFERDGRPTDETLAIEALNRLAHEARANPGALLTLTLPDRAKAWLDAGHIDWDGPLAKAIGQRYSIIAGERIGLAGDKIDISRDRPA